MVDVHVPQDPALTRDFVAPGSYPPEPPTEPPPGFKFASDGNGGVIAGLIVSIEAPKSPDPRELKPLPTHNGDIYILDPHERNRGEPLSSWVASHMQRSRESHASNSKQGSH